jgi:hypothetical protein
LSVAALGKRRLAEFWGMFEVDSNGKEMLLGRPMPEHIQTLHQDFSRRCEPCFR